MANNHYTNDRFVVSNFDPDFDDIAVFCDQLEVHIDGARPGTLSEHGKMALLVKYCDHEDVRDIVTSWRTNGTFH